MLGCDRCFDETNALGTFKRMVQAICQNISWRFQFSTARTVKDAFLLKQHPLYTGPGASRSTCWAAAGVLTRRMLWEPLNGWLRQRAATSAGSSKSRHAKQSEHASSVHWSRCLSSTCCTCWAATGVLTRRMLWEPLDGWLRQRARTSAGGFKSRHAQQSEQAPMGKMPSF